MTLKLSDLTAPDSDPITVVHPAQIGSIISAKNPPAIGQQVISHTGTIGVVTGVNTWGINVVIKNGFKAYLKWEESRHKVIS